MWMFQKHCNDKLHTCFIAYIDGRSNIEIWRKRLSIQTIPNVRFAESRMLERSIDIVIGPTPPGTGVMADTTLIASSKQTSPKTRKPWPLGFCKLYLNALR